MTTLETSIRDLADKRRLTIVSLADKAQLPAATVHNIMSRGDAKLSQLKQLAEALGVSVCQLIGERQPDDMPALTAEALENYVPVKKYVEVLEKNLELQEELKRTGFSGTVGQS